MKTALLMIASLAVACSHTKSAQTTATPPAEVDVVVVHPDPDETVSVVPTDAVVPAALDHLRKVIDGAMQTEPRLDDEQVASALDAIADALAALPQPDMLSVDTIRTDASTLRKMEGRSPHDGRTLRRALDQAVARLHVMEGGKLQDDAVNATRAVQNVSTKRSIMQQTAVVRDALCAVANAVSVEANTGRYGCVEHTLGTAVNEH